MQDREPVHVSGAERAPREPSRTTRRLVVAGMTIGLGLAFLAGNPETEPTRADEAISVPSPATSLPLADPLPHRRVFSPLDRIVPGFSGTLVATAATPSGTEVWRWSTGPGGSLRRSEPRPSRFDARPDPTGTWVLGISRLNERAPLLEADIEHDPVPVHWDVDSFAWHPNDRGAVGWMAAGAERGTASLQLGRHLDEGILFKPAADRIAIDPASAYRVVALDELGFVVERVDAERSFTVRRWALDGEETGVTTGMYVGHSPGGQVAVLDGRSTRFLTGVALEESAVLPEPFTSVAWSTDGSQLAAANAERDTLEIFQGAARTTISVGPIRPSILTWDATGRFVIVTGRVEGESVLVFVDSAGLDVRTVLVPASPVAGVVVP